MIKFSKVLTVLTVIGVLMLINSNTFAQCAMCQATIESNLKSGGTAGSGLNNGIMYLMAAPYLAIAGIGLLWYKKYRKKNITLDIKDQKINLN